MPLIICPECKKKISDQAASCIHCGHPLRPAVSTQKSYTLGKEKTIELTAKRLKLISILSIILIVIGSTVSIMDCSGSEEVGTPFLVGIIILGIGLMSYMINRFRIWWHHK